MKTLNTALLALALPTALFAQEEAPLTARISDFATVVEARIATADPAVACTDYRWIKDTSHELAEAARAGAMAPAAELGLTYAVAASLETTEPDAAGYLSALAAWRYVNATTGAVSGAPLTRLQNVHYYARKAEMARSPEQLARMHRRLVRQVEGLALAMK
jgi:hypothetical protein